MNNHKYNLLKATRCTLLFYHSTENWRKQARKKKKKNKQPLQSFFIVKEVVLGEESVDT